MNISLFFFFFSYLYGNKGGRRGDFFFFFFIRWRECGSDVILISWCVGIYQK